MVITPVSILSAIAALAAVLALIWLAGRAARFGGLANRPAGSSSTTNRVLALGFMANLRGIIA